MLSWRCSVHKIQGFSLDPAIPSFDLEKEKSVSEGQMYVALSRHKYTQSLSYWRLQLLCI